MCELYRLLDLLLPQSSNRARPCRQTEDKQCFDSSVSTLRGEPAGTLLRSSCSTRDGIRGGISCPYAIFKSAGA